MTYVAINIMQVPEGAGATVEARFAARRDAVNEFPGFQGFQLLRPVEGTNDYVVVMHWRERSDYRAWVDSQSFREGHDANARPASTGTGTWGFEVALESPAARG